MNDLPLVSLGQGDYRRDLHAADLADKGVLGSIGLIISAVLREPAKTYHAKASRYLSSHALGEFRRCPLLYRRRKLGLVPDRDSPAYLLGRAAHTLILEVRVAYERAFAVGGPINPRTGQPFGAGTKAFAEWAASTGREGLDDQRGRSQHDGAGDPGDRQRPRRATKLQRRLEDHRVVAQQAARH